MLLSIQEIDNLITQERKIYEMSTRKMASRNRRKKVHKNENSIEKLPTKSTGNKVWQLITNNISGIIVGVFVLIIWYIVHDLPESVNELKIEMSEARAEISNLGTRVTELDKNYEMLDDHVWSIKGDSKITEEPVILIASSGFSYRMIKAAASSESIEEIDDNEIIGINIENNEEVSKDSMKNLPFILSYEENGETVFLYGKYNEDGKWDGECLINRYKNSKLTFIMEAKYEGGELKEYQQVFRGRNSRDQEVWYVSKREVKGNENSGETTTYFFYGDYQKKIDEESVTKEDMLYIEDFVKTIPSTIEGYYNGYTSDGKYNDDSGNAYLVKYNKSGKVRYLYKGIIKDGSANDNTGNAWSLSWGYADDGYYYYKGKFIDGERENTPKNWKPITQEEINEIVNSEDFKCPLTGLLGEWKY